jgi:hypothetical protein
MLRPLSAALLLAAAIASQAAAQDQGFAKKVKPFIDKYCTDCHGEETKRAGLRLDNLKPDFNDARTMATWVKVHDKIAHGEMPPKKRPRPPEADLKDVTQWLHTTLHAASLDKQKKEGRVVLRRLNGTEYENTLRDLLALDDPVQLKSILPEDNVAGGFDNISAALEISPAHLLCYQDAAEKALRAAVPRAPQLGFNEKRTGKQIAAQPQFFKELIGKSCYFKDDALVFPARLPDHYTMCCTAMTQQTGRYRVTASVYALNTDGKPLTMAFCCRPIRDRGVHELRKVVDVPENKPTVFEAEFTMNRECTVWLHAWSLPDRYELSLRKVKPPFEDYKGPSLVVEWIQIEGPIGPWPTESYQTLYKDVPIKARSVAKAEIEKKQVPKIGNRTGSFWENYDPLVPASANPREDAERLMRDFLPRALRRPVSEELKKHYVKVAHDRLDQKYTFAEAMAHAYKAVLSSTHFLYLNEPGTAKLNDKKDFASTRLDDYALASRLSYFLWSSMPDAILIEAAGKGELSKPASLRRQVERMLNDPKAQRFTENFTGQWLDMRKIKDTTPDMRLYREFDEWLAWSMLRETELFFEEIVRQDRSLLEFVDSDWTFLNERLARHYGIDTKPRDEVLRIPGIIGSDLRKTKLPADSHRGGVMTHASVLKVTADGTRTSPVLRGKWVLERIIGKPPSPPPPDIPFFEPDIRGATTIREQLDKHRNTPACATYHVHIDPPGFALENFDAIGGWRDFYRAAAPTKKGNVKGTSYYRGPDVEVGGVTPDGKEFKNIDDYKKILLADKDQIARNLTQNLLVYATGAEIQYADREVVEGIVATLRERNYGFRTLIHEVVQSRVFLHK